MMRRPWLMCLLLSVVRGAPWTCQDLKTVYANSSCCSAHGTTCVHSLPDCADGDVLQYNGGQWACTNVTTLLQSVLDIAGIVEQDVANDVLSCPNDGPCFYVVDREDPPAGYRVLTIGELDSLKADFVSQYNSMGLPPAQVFQSGNCCVATKSGHKLTISGTPYGYQFPAATTGGIRCNPSGGYTESHYRFYRVPSLTMASSLSSAAACATSHNPAVAIRVV